MVRRVARDVFFKGVTAPLRLDGADAVLSLLPELVPGWPFRVLPTRHAAPFFTISDTPNGQVFRCESHVEDRPAQSWDALNAVCDALASLSVALPQSDDRLISLHAAGVEFAGRLVVFPNVRRAGKSTLTVALARAGHRVFSDDVVPLTFPQDGPPLARATGIAPRLRLPLPESLPDDFRTWSEMDAGPRNRQYHYLALPDLPPHGETLPLGACVLLDRRDEPVPARLDPVALDAAMDALLHQNFTRDRHSADVLEVIAAMLAAIPIRRLVYSDLDEAVRCLQAGFAAGPALPGAAKGSERRFRVPDYADRPPAPIGPLSQRAGSVGRWIGEVLYLADPAGRAIQRMDPLAAAIWAMLEDPATPDELVAALAEAFPDTPPERLRSDLAALLDRLSEAGLVAPPDAA